MKIPVPPSKKERAFYFQGFLVVGYVGLRFMNGNLASFDPQFTTLMALLASYHITQGAVDFMEKAKVGSPKPTPKEGESK